MLRMDWKTLNWPNALFLLGTPLVVLVGVPLYAMRFGLDAFQVALFFAFFVFTGMSVTLGYHRLFAHRSFEAAWPVRFLTLMFGAAAFENSALSWVADHRRHHKFTDHEGDPYDISKGFWHAHMGWVLEKTPPLAREYVRDLERDALVMWQHRYYVPTAILAGLGLPALLGGLWNGWAGALGGFLLAGIARTVMVQHFTFFINSLCHTLGRQPYSQRCTARDSALMAWFTFGEGYHNFHHAFQHDYRNGVKPWQFDPTKWCIWLLHRLGLARHLRRVPNERILLAELTEQQRRLAAQLEARPAAVAGPLRSALQTAQARLQEAFSQWETRAAEYERIMREHQAASREELRALRRRIREASDQFQAASAEWRQTVARLLSQAQVPQSA